MSSFTRMEFTPPTGLNDKDAFVTTPATEDAARAQIQGILDQLKEYINNFILEELENAVEGSSGSEKIGSAEIDGIIGTTVRAQLQDLKSKLKDATSGNLIDGAIDRTALFVDSIITGLKIAENSIDSDHYIDKSIDPEHLADNAVTLRAMADDSVDYLQIKDAAVRTEHIQAGQVTNDKLSTNAVSTAKIIDEAVSTNKLDDGSVTTAKIGTGAVIGEKIGTGAVIGTKIASDAVTSSKIADNAVGDDQLAANDRTRKITISSSGPSGGSNGDIWLEII